MPRPGRTLAALLLLALGVSPCLAEDEAPAARHQVLVELFTSQG